MKNFSLSLNRNKPFLGFGLTYTLMVINHNLNVCNCFFNKASKTLTISFIFTPFHWPKMKYYYHLREILLAFLCLISNPLYFLAGKEKVPS